MKKAPLVSIITINYNQTQITNELLNSLSLLTYKSVEIIVVDNGSKHYKQQDFHLRSNVKIIRSEQNLGFAGGNNLGIQHSNGKYLLFLNNDTEVNENFLQPLIKILECNPKAGAVSPKIKYFQQPNLIQYAGYSKMNPFTLQARCIGNKQNDDGSYDQLSRTHFNHGCAMMVRQNLILELGPMPEIYFLYYEELDWCTRIKRAGYELYYQPQSVVYHKESISTGKNSPLKTYYLTRNRILYFRRNIKGFMAVFTFLYLTIIAVPKGFVTLLFTFQWKHLNQFRKAIFWHLKLKPVASSSSIVKPYPQTQFEKQTTKTEQSWRY
ncbi:MAG: glycosyltransferase family 2 protein [Marinifilaceae bacterium]